MTAIIWKAQVHRLGWCTWVQYSRGCGWTRVYNRVCDNLFIYYFCLSIWADTVRFSMIWAEIGPKIWAKISV